MKKIVVRFYDRDDNYLFSATYIKSDYSIVIKRSMLEMERNNAIGWLCLQWDGGQEIVIKEEMDNEH